MGVGSGTGNSGEGYEPFMHCGRWANEIPGAEFRWYQKIDEDNLTKTLISKDWNTHKEREGILLDNSEEAVSSESRKSSYLFKNGGIAVSNRDLRHIYCTPNIEGQLKRWFGLQKEIEKKPNYKTFVGSQKTPEAQRGYIRRTTR